MKKTLFSVIVLLALIITSGFIFSGVVSAEATSPLERIAESLGVEFELLTSETSNQTPLITVYIETTVDELKTTLTVLNAELEAVHTELEAARYVFILIDENSQPLHLVSIDQTDSSLVELFGIEEGSGTEDGDVKLGQVFATKTLEFTLNSVEIVEKVLPPDTSGFHTFYEAAEGKRYVFVDLDVKNLGKEDVMFSDLYTPTLIYDDGYTYRGQILVLRNESNFSYANINSLAPLATEFAGVMFEVPEELERSEKPITITFMSGDSLFRYRYR